MVEPIRIQGLAEFMRGVKRVDRDLGKAFRVAANNAASSVVDDAKSSVPSGPPKGGHSSSSIKARSTQTQVRVSAGSKRFPYYAWLDFGGRVGRRKSVVRPYRRSGRYLWASFSRNRPQLERGLAGALTDIARQAGLEPD